MIIFPSEPQAAWGPLRASYLHFRRSVRHHLRADGAGGNFGSGIDPTNILLDLKVLHRVGAVVHGDNGSWPALFRDFGPFPQWGGMFLPASKDSLKGPNEHYYCSEWKCKGGKAEGLRNLGNTCYLNSVLRCLTYTPPLANFCLKSLHSSSCDATPEIRRRESVPSVY
nr:ubiquitin carboxyl-terminal hydrolase 25-like [Ipomoea batatas]